MVFDQDYTSDYFDVWTSEKLERGFNIWAYSGEKEPGVYEATLDFGYFTCAVPITVVENPIQEIALRENADRSLTITATDADGERFEIKVLDLGEWWEIEEGEYFASLWTDHGQFDAVIYDGDTFAIELQLNSEESVISNSIPSSAWFEFMREMEDHYWYLATPYSWLHEGESIYFNGEITAENIDAVIEMAGNLDGLWDSLHEDEDTQYDNSDFFQALLAPAEAVEEAVLRQFGLEVDLTFSENYNAETGLYRYAEPAFWDNSRNRPTKVGYDHGIWAVEFAAYSETNEDYIMRMNISEEGKILSFTVNSEYLPGDVSGDGTVTIADAVLALRVLSENLDAAQINEKAGDVVIDRTAPGMTTADIIKILRYILKETPVLA